MVGGTRFYERREVKDALAYLRVLANPDETVNLRRILNTPRRGIGERAEACVEALSVRDRISFGEALRKAADAPGISGRSANADAPLAIVHATVVDVEGGRTLPGRTVVIGMRG